jgi:SAM-dependent methyltransferase
MTAESKDGVQATSDAFAERLLGSALGMIDVLSVYLGDRLGLYRSLVEEPATAAELAERTTWNERYLREWLEQQAVAGILDVSPGDAASRRYSLPAGHADVLLNRESQNYLSPITRMLTAAANATRPLLDAYRTGGGLRWEDYGDDMREGQGEINRPAFLHLLPSEWLPAIPDVHARLQGDPGARVADIGCGVGWSAIGIARTYPKAQVDGFDLDAAAIALAQQHAWEENLTDRVRFHVQDASDPKLTGQFDLVLILEALHDMSRPVEALKAARGLLNEGGSVLVLDERVAEEFTAPGGEIERLMYGWSILACLANGLADLPSAATGTVMRPETVRRYASEAGFGTVEIVPAVEHPFFRMYRLRA